MLRAERKPSDEVGNVLKEGSLVIVYEGFKLKRMVTLKRGATVHSKNGVWKHEYFIGRRYGDRVIHLMSDKRGKWEAVCHLLRPTMEQWTDTLSHRTQIIYMPDISYITARLGLASGKTVVEAGTGSGSLTHSLARAVAPAGKVLTFDFHEDRSKIAGAEFAAHNLGHVTAGHRDVCTQYEEGMSHADWGFGLPPGTADALMLDVPSPWLAIKAVHATLKDNGVFCNYSPCIEQVQKTCLALTDFGFTHLATVEVLRKEYTEHTTRYKRFESRDDRVSRKRKWAETEAAAEGVEGQAPAVEGGAGDAEEAEPAAEAKAVVDVEMDDAEINEGGEELVAEAKRLLIPVLTSRGHTAYLTFAYKAPLG